MSRFPRALAALALTAFVAACSSSPKAPEPADLGPPTNLIGTRQIWSVNVGPAGAAFAPVAVSGRVYAASENGQVLAVNQDNGAVVWRLDLRQNLATGVGSDGKTTAAVTADNLLVAIGDGEERWRVRLPARAYTAPLVAGGRVFVLTADRTLTAFDAANGARLWTQTRSADPLVLDRPAALAAVGDTLVAGISGRLAGFSPDNGAVRWEVPIATARGTNEVERLVDIVAPVSRMGSDVCVRAYGAAVGCVDSARGQAVWTKPAKGLVGVHGDDRLLFGSESDGTLVAWRRSSGEEAWRSQRLRYRHLGAPLALGRVFAVADDQGRVFLLSREDGSEMARLSTDGSAIAAPLLLAGDALVALSSRGLLAAWRPE